MRKFISMLLAGAMLATATVSFAAAPSEYDGKAYKTLGYESNDPDGELNLAVIANGDVKIYGDAMYIEGSVYSNGTIYGGNGAGNVIKGVFISGTENQTETGVGDYSVVRYGYVHVDDDGNTDVTNAYSTGLEHEGAILDKSTSFDYSYTPYTYPEISNYIESDIANQYRSVSVVSEDTHFGTLDDVSSAGFIIDATEKDITIVIDTLNVSANPYIQVFGDHHVNLYVKNWVQNGGEVVNLELAKSDGNNSWDTVDQWAYIQNSIYAMDANGIPRPNKAVLDELNPNQIDFYVDTATGVVNFQGARIAANIHSNAETLTFGNNLEIYGNIESGAKVFETLGSGYINGNVAVPNADSTVHNSSCIQGQLVTNTLLINGAGSILQNADSIVVNKPSNDKEDDKKDVYLDIVEDVIYVVAGDKCEVNVNHSGNYHWEYTSITSYPEKIIGEDGTDRYYDNAQWASYNDDKVTVTTVAGNEWWKPTGEFLLKAVLKDDPSITDTVKIIIVASADEIPSEPTPTPAPVPDGEEIDLEGVGYAYIFGYEPKISYVYDEAEGGKLVAEVEMAPQDAVTREQVAAMIMRLIDQKYDTMNADYALTDNMKQHAGTWYERGLAYLASKGTFDGVDSVEIGAVTRGEVAKLVAYGLNLSKTAETSFSDIDNNEYKTYIEMMTAYGYMQGMSDTEFMPEKVMTRAEFCSMFNHIIGRENAKLESADGIQVTPELYSIVDLDGHWAKDVMLRATSAYNADGYVDVETRLANIRNELDKYDAQKYF